MPKKIYYSMFGVDSYESRANAINATFLFTLLATLLNHDWQTSEMLCDDGTSKCCGDRTTITCCDDRTKEYLTIENIVV